MTFNCENGTKDRSLGVVDVVYVVGVVHGQVSCLVSFDTQAVLLKLTRSNVATSMFEGKSGHYEVDLASEGEDSGWGWPLP